MSTAGTYPSHETARSSAAAALSAGGQNAGRTEDGNGGNHIRSAEMLTASALALAAMGSLVLDLGTGQNLASPKAAAEAASENDDGAVFGFRRRTVRDFVSAEEWSTARKTSTSSDNRTDVASPGAYDVSSCLIYPSSTTPFFFLLCVQKYSHIEFSGLAPFDTCPQTSIRALKGGRLSMEDAYFVADGGRFAAVFDGHGGGGVSQYLRDRLYEKFIRFNRATEGDYRDEGALAENPKYPSIASFVSAFRSSFEEVDKEVCMNNELQYQGSTAVAVAVHEDKDGTRTLVSANVGDSRAILSRRGRAVDLTRDHKPNDEREKARILAMGERIEWDHYCKVHRVRNLSLSRAIGDRFAKPAVSGEAEIKRFPVVEEGDEFILLASDGLWDVMSSSEVVSFVHNRLDSPAKTVGKPVGPKSAKLVRRKSMSRFVANEAIKRGSGDNVCVVIVWLKGIDDST